MHKQVKKKTLKNYTLMILDYCTIYKPIGIEKSILAVRSNLYSLFNFRNLIL
jgi:hypothetical protein